MAIEGWYYLHKNGDLIYKRESGSTAADIRESNFARGLWAVDPTNRENAWSILVEALAAGANKNQIDELADKWALNDDDALIYADRVGCNINKDGDKWCATRKDFKDLQQSIAGFGDNCLEAFSSLAKALGYESRTMWGVSFEKLLK